MTLSRGPAILVAGVSGMIVNAIVAALAVPGAGLFAMLSDPWRWGAAIAAAGLLPVIFANLPPVIRWFVAVIVLTAVTALFAKLFLGAPTAFSYVLSFHTVYGAVAATVYRMATTRP